MKLAFRSVSLAVILALLLVIPGATTAIDGDNLMAKPGPGTITSELYGTTQGVRMSTNTP
jgi:hypothetical protein